MNQGLTKDEMKQFTDILIKANAQQLIILGKTLQDEIHKRTAQLWRKQR